MRKWRCCAIACLPEGDGVTIDLDSVNGGWECFGAQNGPKRLKQISTLVHGLVSSGSHTGGFVSCPMCLLALLGTVIRLVGSLEEFVGGPTSCACLAGRSTALRTAAAAATATRRSSSRIFGGFHSGLENQSDSHHSNREKLELI